MKKKNEMETNKTAKGVAQELNMDELENISGGYLSFHDTTDNRGAIQVHDKKTGEVIKTFYYKKYNASNALARASKKASDYDKKHN